MNFLTHSSLKIQQNIMSLSINNHQNKEHTKRIPFYDEKELHFLFPKLKKEFHLLLPTDFLFKLVRNLEIN